jgi:hypothetical protein
LAELAVKRKSKVPIIAAAAICGAALATAVVLSILQFQDEPTADPAKTTTGDPAK